MKKNHILLSIIIFAGCCKEPKFLKNGLTKSANKVTETYLRLELDSLNNTIFDTISITEHFYDENNLIIRRLEKTLFDDQTVEIDYIYDETKKIQKEIVKMSLDTATVNYFYNDTLLHKTSSKIINAEFEFEQITKHEYGQDSQLSKISISQTFKDIESGDTTLNSLTEKIYNEKKQLIESKTINFTNPDYSSKIVYKYRCGIKISSQNFDQYDSLISFLNYEYIYDEYDNWIEKKTIENKDLKYIRKREIEYG